eukprot:12040226-Heterocapsa_arctica.AAC.1
MVEVSRNGAHPLNFCNVHIVPEWTDTYKKYVLHSTSSIQGTKDRRSLQLLGRRLQLPICGRRATKLPNRYDRSGI